MKASVLVLDFGSQVTQLIARRTRELGVFSEIVSCLKKPSEVDLTNVKAIVLSGGPASVTGEDAPDFSPEWLKLGLPTLAICYGMQLVAHHFGGKLVRGGSREYGHADLEILKNEAILKGFSCQEKTSVWMSHGDHVETIPPGFELMGKSAGAPVAVIGNKEKKIYAILFHPEVVHTKRGKEIIENFLFEVAGLKQDWNSAGFIEATITGIREKLEKDSGANAKVICGLSGGVDSSVAAVLVDRAVHGKLINIFVDNGLLRKNEAQQVLENMRALGLNVVHADARERFLSELKGVEDPEKKRKIIGRVFIEVFDEESKKIGGATHLVQGTLYPDVIESVSVRGPSATIKTHHNVGGLPEHMNLKLIEPLRELFKDEVRLIGKDLDIPQSVLQRQPFPGPGLAVRVLGEVNEDRLKLLREADSIFVEEIRAAGLYRDLWQSFAVLLPIKSVGVMGDGRTYEMTVALRAVYSEDGMTADWAYLPQDLLRKVSNRIINEVRGINRVVLDISSKPPATIEWE